MLHLQVMSTYILYCGLPVGSHCDITNHTLNRKCSKQLLVTWSEALNFFPAPRSTRKSQKQKITCQ